MRGIGADVVIDYTREDFADAGETYDFIFDAVGKRSFRQCTRALRRGGLYISADVGFLWQNVFLALGTKIIRTKRVRFPIPRYTQADVEWLAGLVEAGAYRPVIDRDYPLDQLVDATRYVETEQKTGNVVILVAGAG